MPFKFRQYYNDYMRDYMRLYMRTKRALIYIEQERERKPVKQWSRLILRLDLDLSLKDINPDNHGRDPYAPKKGRPRGAYGTKYIKKGSKMDILNRNQYSRYSAQKNTDT